MVLDLIQCIPSVHKTEQITGKWQDIIDWTIPQIVADRKYNIMITFVASVKFRQMILDNIAGWSQNSHKSVKCTSLITEPCDEPNTEWFKLYDEEYMTAASVRQLYNITKRHDVFTSYIRFNMSCKAQCWQRVAATIYAASYLVSIGGAIIIAIDGECCYSDQIYNHMPRIVHSALNMVSKLGELTVWDVDETTVFAIRKCKRAEFSAKACKILLGYLATFKQMASPIEYRPY